MADRRAYQNESAPRLPNPIYALGVDEATDETANCQICGEDADAEMGEFWIPEEIRKPGGEPSIIAHGQCGIDHNLPLA
jgi:hypothetical protein